MGVLQDVTARAQADPAVQGLILTGSHARGMATPHSDYDLVVVVAQRGGQWVQTSRSPEFDEIVYTVEDLADTSDAWQRYAFRGAQVLLDRLEGRIVDLVQRQCVPTPTEAAAVASEALDGYLNQVYRAAKNRRDGRLIEARLDETESVSWLLSTLFALHGRIRPYNKYLRWELRTYPLGDPWDPDTLPERIADHPAGLFADIEDLARRRGHGDVIDAWGDELDLLR